MERRAQQRQRVEASMLLRDKVCIITGAASLRGIGYATAELFVEHGARIVVADMAMDDRIAANIKSALDNNLCQPVELHAVRCDIGSPADCKNLIDGAVAKFG